MPSPYGTGDDWRNINGFDNGFLFFHMCPMLHTSPSRHHVGGMTRGREESFDLSAYAALTDYILLQGPTIGSHFLGWTFAHIQDRTSLPLAF